MAEPAPLYHFSEEGDIALFTPRAPRVLPKRPPGQSWLNGPLVWAIDAAHAPLYLFPRDCPRILVWPRPKSAPASRRAHGLEDGRMTAYVETAWMARIARQTLWRYSFAPGDFERLNDAGMAVAKRAQTPTSVIKINDLPKEHRRAGLHLRPLERLTALRALWQSDLHVSGIRLRNAQDW